MSSIDTRAQRIKTASAKRREAKKAETRQAILNAATGLFLEHGHDNFSLRQVAEAIGYSPTTIYLYFKDKEDLLFNAAIEGFIKFAHALQAAYDSSNDPWERLMNGGEAYVQFGLENPVHYRLMFMGRGEFLAKDIPQEDCESVSDSFEILHTMVKECQASGVMIEGDSSALSALVWSGVHGIVSLHLGTPNLTKEQAYGLFDLHKSMNLNALRP